TVIAAPVTSPWVTSSEIELNVATTELLPTFSIAPPNALPPLPPLPPSPPVPPVAESPVPPFPPPAPPTPPAPPSAVSSERIWAGLWRVFAEICGEVSRCGGFAWGPPASVLNAEMTIPDAALLPAPPRAEPPLPALPPSPPSPPLALLGLSVSPPLP